MARSRNIVVTEIAPPTLGERIDAQQRRAAAALSVFQSAAIELEVAAEELDNIVLEATQIAEQHDSIAVNAGEEADRNREQAARIRTLFA